jgi:hypothetical protein
MHRKSLGCILLNGVTDNAGATTRDIAYSPDQAERRELNHHWGGRSRCIEGSPHK